MLRLCRRRRVRGGNPKSKATPRKARNPSGLCATPRMRNRGDPSLPRAQLQVCTSMCVCVYVRRRRSIYRRSFCCIIQYSGISLLSHFYPPSHVRTYVHPYSTAHMIILLLLSLFLWWVYCAHSIALSLELNYYITKLFGIFFFNIVIMFFIDEKNNGNCNVETLDQGSLLQCCAHKSARAGALNQ